MDDDALFQTMRGLSSAVIGDVLDQMGLRRQFLPPGLAPLDPRTVMAGRAMPVLEADLADGEADDPGRKPFGLMLEALDDLRPGEVYVAAGASPRYALWGELMSTRAQVLGAAGAVLDGPVRDAAGIEALGFPCFGRGVYAQDQGPRGAVVDFRTRVEVAGIPVAPGAFVFGDREGVLVIPPEAEAEAVARAVEKARAEDVVGRAIRGGMSAVEAFRTHGVM